MDVMTKGPYFSSHICWEERSQRTCGVHRLMPGTLILDPLASSLLGMLFPSPTSFSMLFLTWIFVTASIDLSTSLPSFSIHSHTVVCSKNVSAQITLLIASAALGFRVQVGYLASRECTGNVGFSIVHLDPSQAQCLACGGDWVNIRGMSSTLECSWWGRGARE